MVMQTRDDLQAASTEQARILNILRNGTLYIPDSSGGNGVPAIIIEHEERANETLRQLALMQPLRPKGYLL